MNVAVQASAHEKLQGRYTLRRAEHQQVPGSDVIMFSKRSHWRAPEGHPAVASAAKHVCQASRSPPGHAGATHVPADSSHAPACTWTFCARRCICMLVAWVRKLASAHLFTASLQHTRMSELKNLLKIHVDTHVTPAGVLPDAVNAQKRPWASALLVAP